MNKKLMLLAAGVLTALAFSALPSVASAGEPIIHCTGEACEYTVTSTEHAVLSTSNGKTVTCSAVSGTGAVTNGTSTGSVKLTFTNCREQVTIFKFSCNSPGAAAGTIVANTMTTHNVYLEKKAQVANGTPGILLTGANVTFECAGWEKVTVTGNVIGHLENSTTVCNTPSKTFQLKFEATAHGVQRWTQKTTEGTIFDLVANSTTGSTHPTTYNTAAQSGTGDINFKNNVTLTCAPTA